MSNWVHHWCSESLGGEYYMDFASKYTIVCHFERKKVKTNTKRVKGDMFTNMRDCKLLRKCSKVQQDSLSRFTMLRKGIVHGVSCQSHFCMSSLPPFFDEKWVIPGMINSKSNVEMLLHSCGSIPMSNWVQDWCLESLGGQSYMDFASKHTILCHFETKKVKNEHKKGKR